MQIDVSPNATGPCHSGQGEGIGLSMGIHFTGNIDLHSRPHCFERTLESVSLRMMRSLQDFDCLVLSKHINEITASEPD